MKKIVSLIKIKVFGNEIYQATDFEKGPSEFSMTLPFDLKDTDGNDLNDSETYILKYEQNSINFMNDLDEPKLTLKKK